MFKKTLLATALTTAVMGANAVQVFSDDTSSLEVYGNVAISIWNTEPGDTEPGDVPRENTGWSLANESRIGFRGHKDLTDNLTAFVQMEGGNVADSGAGIGERDTFVGLKGDWGKIRFGRMLTPMYEIVDWPFSNPGMGGVFDGNSDIGGFHRDRHSQQVQYNLPTIGAFNAAVTTGRGDAVDTDSYFYGASASYRFADMVTVSAGLETEANRLQAADAGFHAGELTDTLGAIVGVQVTLPAGFQVKAGYKYGETESVASGITANQSFVSVIGEYWTGDLGLRLGYAATFDAEQNNVTAEDTADYVVSFQPMYVVGDALFYGRVRTQALDNADSDVTVGLGLEYGF